MVALRRTFSREAQVVAQVFVDIVVITLLMHATGGLSSGFGLLLVVTVAGGSILIAGRIAALFAAMAAIAILTQQIYVYLYEPFASPQYTHAGFLGLSFFATALVISVSARRMRHSQALAQRWEVDLANLAQLNDHIIQRMQSGVLAVDEVARVRFMNRSAQHLLGLAEWSPRTPLAGLAPELAGLHQLWLQAPERSSHILEPAPGGVRAVVSFAAIGEQVKRGAVVFVEDAGATTQRAQQLKLASLGRLAGSIAHEIRNPLGAISHAGQLLDESANLDESDRRLTRIIRENSLRMNTMVENVLRLGRGRPAVLQRIELGVWIRDFLDEFETRREGARGAVEMRVAPPQLQVRADPSQLHQVLWNLCDNALHHAGEPPQVLIDAGIDSISGRPFLEVTDNGNGIPSSELDRVFEPFFTTRVQGTGLGLYIARELCEGNLASLTLEPSERGCRFRVTFPHPRRRGVEAA
jgi:two-component system sensor histidine kinase PilS (NtrC family)